MPIYIAGAEALDTYDEGTFTPVFGGAVNGTGAYTKIGRIVHLWFGVLTDNLSGGIHPITAMPFTCTSAFIGGDHTYDMYPMLVFGYDKSSNAASYNTGGTLYGGMTPGSTTIMWQDSAYVGEDQHLKFYTCYYTD